MISTFLLAKQQAYRELLIQMRQIRFLVNSCLFLLIFLCMFPLSIKPEVTLLRTIAPGVVWMALLFSMLLSIEGLFVPDFEQGVLEQWMVSGRSLPLLVFVKVIAHWLVNLLPLLLICPVVALLFSLTVWETGILALTLICATPALLFLCALVAAFSLGINQKGLLMALILLPLTLPILIFGSGTLNMAIQGLAVSGNLALLLAISVLAVGFLPYAIAGVLSLSR